MAYSKQTWVTGETITASKLNHIEDGIDAISANGAIGTANLANASVTNAKLDQGAVDTSNIANGAVGTTEIQDGAVTAAKLGTDVKSMYQINLAKINGQVALGLEVGTINLDGTDGNSTTRARTSVPFSKSFILLLNDGFKIKNVFRYNYDEYGNLSLDGYTAHASNIAVFLSGKFVTSTTSPGISADAFRISFSKSNDSQTITDSDIDGMISVCKFVNTDKVVNLTGLGTSGGAAGVVNVGDIYYNTSSKLLRILVTGTTYYTVPYADGTLYVCQNHVYVWNGTDLVRADADVVSSATSLASDLSTVESNVSAIQGAFSQAHTLVFEQGGISLSGQDDDGASATRIRTKFINLNANVDFSVASGYQARIATYDKGGNFISLTDYGTSFSNIDNVTKLIRILVKHSNGSNILVSEMTSDTYAFTLNKNIYTDVVPVDYYETMFGSPELYSSQALTHDSIDSKTSAELFAEYDALVTAYPKFFKKDGNIGQDAYGNNIPSYTLGFTDCAVYDGESGTTNLWDSTYNYTKILITSGVHGGEKSASWGLMLAIKELLQSTQPWANYIKGNMILKIVPCVNVWGFDNNSRLNYKDVNVNRDAYTWASEEGQALKSWYDANTDAIYYMDVHGTNGGRGYQEIWNLSPYKYVHARNCAKIASSLYGEWMTKFGKFPTFPAIISTYNGLLVSYLEANNIPAAIVEIPRDIKDGTTDNYLDSCAFAKDVILNMIQGIGAKPFRKFPII